MKQQKTTKQVAVKCGVVQLVNPAWTVCFKSLLCIKSCSAVLFIPHPKVKRCVAQTAHIILSALIDASLPPIIAWIDEVVFFFVFF